MCRASVEDPVYVSGGGAFGEFGVLRTGERARLAMSWSTAAVRFVTLPERCSLALYNAVKRCCWRRVKPFAHVGDGERDLAARHGRARIGRPAYDGKFGSYWRGERCFTKC